MSVEQWNTISIEELLSEDEVLQFAGVSIERIKAFLRFPPEWVLGLLKDYGPALVELVPGELPSSLEQALLVPVTLPNHDLPDFFLNDLIRIRASYLTLECDQGSLAFPQFYENIRHELQKKPRRPKGPDLLNSYLQQRANQLRQAHPGIEEVFVDKIVSREERLSRHFEEEEAWLQNKKRVLLEDPQALLVFAHRLVYPFHQ